MAWDPHVASETARVLDAFLQHLPVDLFDKSVGPWESMPGLEFQYLPHERIHPEVQALIDSSPYELALEVMHVVGPVHPHAHTNTGGSVHVLHHPTHDSNHGLIYINDKWQDVHPGQTLTVGPGAPHGFDTIDGHDFWVVSVESPRLDPADRVEHTGYTD